MGKPQSTGNLTNALAQDSSNNIGIGGAANASFKLQVTGATNLTGALTGTTSAFTTRVDIGTRSSGNIRNLNIYGATNGNAIIKLDGTDGNGYGAQIDFLSKTTGGTTNTWTLGTGVTAGANAFELFNGATTILNFTQAGAATFSSSVTAGGKIFTSASVNDNILEVINSDTTNGYGLYVRGGGTASGRYVARFKNGADNDVMWVGNTGNVGIGVTPSAWDTTIFKGLQVANSNAFLVGRVDAASQLQIGTNTYYNADGNWKFIQNGYATRYIQNSGVHSWEYSNASGTAGNNVTFNEAMRITSGGDVLVGSTSSILTGTNNRVFQINATSSSYIGFSTSGQLRSYLFADSSSAGITSYTNIPLTFGTNNSERMRIASDGVVTIKGNVGTLIQQATTAGSEVFFQWWNSAGARRGYIGYGGTPTTILDLWNVENGAIQFGTNNSLKMTIAANGSIGAPSGTNIYNASDLRLKRNVTTITNGLDKINALNPVKFNWIDGFEPSENEKDLLGFIAQEVQSVIPEAVEGFNSGNTINLNDVIIENPLRVNEKFIIPVLVKAIQELKAEIDTLKQK
jgi:hypothetical protein